MKKLFVISVAAIDMLGMHLNAWAEDAYVASTSGGNQFINTGYRIKSNTKMEVDFRIDDIVNGKYVFGANGGNGTVCGLCVNEYGNLEPVFGGFCGNIGGAATTTRRTIVYDLPNSSISLYEHGSDTPVATKDSSSVKDNGDASYPIALFSNSTAANGAWANNYLACRIYSFKVWEKNNGSYDLVHDWVPAKKGNEIGFMDAVDGSFICDHRISPTPLVIGGEYTTLEDDDPYIEDDGTSIVNTGVLPDTNLCMEVDYALTTVQRDMRIVGNYVEGGQTVEFYVNQQNPTGMSFQVAKGWPGGTHIGAADLHRRTFVADIANNKICLVTGFTTNNTYTAHATAPINGKGSVPIALFGRIISANGSSDWDGGRAKARIYGVRFYKSGTLFKNLVPCVKGDVAGFRDTIGGTFHMGESNVHGLSAGGNVERIPDDGYIELTGNDATKATGSRGGHYINTGYTPGVNTRIEFDYAFAANMTTAGSWYALASVNNTSAGFSLYATENTLSVCLGTNMWMNTTLPSQTNACYVRRTLVLDAYNSAVTLLTAGYPNFARTNSAPWVTASMPTTLRIGENPGGSGWGFAPVRIYGLRIYESNVLVRDYVPYVDNGAPGLKYGDTFVKISWVADNGKDGLPKAGGNVAVSSERDRDAFVLFSGTQSIDTGYKANVNSKFVVDFSFANGFNSPQQFVFNTGESGNGIWGRIYTSGSSGTGAGYSWSYSKSGNWTSTSITVDHQRRLFTVDSMNNQVRMTPGNYNGDSTMAECDKDYTCTTTTRIGSNVSGAANYARIRLYRFTIFDNGEKVRDFVPYTVGGASGLYDIVSNEVFTTAGLMVSGRGYDGSEEWIVTPQSGALTKNAGMKVLSAFAVGAQSYKWTKNGVAISGGEDGNLAIAWMKGGAIDTYSVAPVYSVFGGEVVGAAVPVIVENVPQGVVISFR